MIDARIARVGATSVYDDRTIEQRERQSLKKDRSATGARYRMGAMIARSSIASSPKSQVRTVGLLVNR
jgi:hypothetical protein